MGFLKQHDLQIQMPDIKTNIAKFNCSSKTACLSIVKYLSSQNNLAEIGYLCFDSIKADGAVFFKKNHAEANKKIREKTNEKWQRDNKIRYQLMFYQNKTHVLFLKEKKKSIFGDNLDKDLRNFINSDYTGLDTYKRDFHQILLEAILNLAIKIDWVNKLDIHLNDIVAANLVYNGDVFYIIKATEVSNKKQNADSQVIVNTVVAKPNVYVSAQNNIITSVQIQSFDYAPLNDISDLEDNDQIKPFILKSQSLNEAVITRLESNLNKMVMSKTDARENKVNFVDFGLKDQSQSLLKESRLTYEIYVQAMIEALLKNSRVDFCNDVFKGDYYLKTFSTVDLDRKNQKLIIVDLIDVIDIKSTKYESVKLKPTKLLQKLVETQNKLKENRQANKEKIQVIDEKIAKILKQEKLWNCLVDDFFEADGVDIESYVISDKVKLKVKSAFLENIKNHFCKYYREVDVISRNDFDIDKMENASYLFLQNEIPFGTRDPYTIVSNKDDIVKLRAQYHDQDNDFDKLKQALKDKRETAKLKKDKNVQAKNQKYDNDIKIKYFNDILEVVGASHNEYVTDTYSDVKIRRFKNQLDNLDLHPTQGYHWEPKDILDGIDLNDETNTLAFSFGKQQNKIDKICNELYLKHDLHVNNAIKLKSNSDSFLGKHLNGNYKAYYIRKVKKWGGGTDLYASCLTFNIDDASIYIKDKVYFTNENELRKECGLENIDKFHNESFYLIDCDNQQRLTIFTAKNTGRVLVTDFNSYWDMVDNPKLTKSKKSIEKSADYLGVIFPHYFLKAKKNELFINNPHKTNNSTTRETIIVQDLGDEGLKMFITLKDALNQAISNQSNIKQLIIHDFSNRRVYHADSRLVELYLQTTMFNMVKLNDFSLTTVFEKLARTMILN